MVSVICLTYNQKDYICKCMEGILMQRTTFAYQLIVHDDASTDGTSEIISRYAESNNNILVYRQKENQYSQGYGLVGLRISLSMAVGTYIAFCEGDDYWIDPYKLQKQVDFLEKHPTYGFVGTRCRVETKQDTYEESCMKKPIASEDKWNLYGNVLRVAVSGPVTRTNTLLFRHTEQVIEKLKGCLGDYSMEVVLASSYFFAQLDEVCSVYRIHEGGVSNGVSVASRRRYAEWYRNNRTFILEEYPEYSAFRKEDINDSYEYTLLKCDIADGCYHEAVKHKSHLLNCEYKKKFFSKFLHGPISFLLLRCIILIKNRTN